MLHERIRHEWPSQGEVDVVDPVREQIIPLCDYWAETTHHALELTDELVSSSESPDRSIDIYKAVLDGRSTLLFITYVGGALDGQRTEVLIHIVCPTSADQEYLQLIATMEL